ncbi:phosphatidylethanolamine-binding protein [Cordyceps fumosorosea ARSEF 2679]|uniref:Phosphatidylethanolamine-binding protein n=1 Tax=Cordyceps fumosorosea (strain ARSEF 2679) TaxID=1081104 RepID=A0A167SU06_CORFA|nr:phosphatidylethanolamine-binding protein [Cordyceps fumosorosea ARSEF 2679]OAA59925.1 phosphatidylethanolamine-binding protein [Cordyceps fumosorosea ARSEF 2679]
MSQLTTSLKEASLVPGAAAALIPPAFAPSVDLSVSFASSEAAPSSSSSSSVRLGNLLRVSQVQREPSVSFQVEAGAAANDGSYLLMLVDPDAPTPEDPKFAFWRHWVVSGLKPPSSSSFSFSSSPALSSSGTTLTAFLGPGPKPESNPHRYLFLLYREPPGLALTRAEVGGDAFVERRSFDVAGFVAAHGLQLAGVNWMLCAADEQSAENE